MRIHHKIAVLDRPTPEHTAQNIIRNRELFLEMGKFCFYCGRPQWLTYRSHSCQAGNNVEPRIITIEEWGVEPQYPYCSNFQEMWINPYWMPIYVHRNYYNSTGFWKAVSEVFGVTFSQIRNLNRRPVRLWSHTGGITAERFQTLSERHQNYFRYLWLQYGGSRAISH